MKEKGFATDAALAAVVECERSMVTRVKLGKAKPSLELAVKLSKALDLPADAFLPRRAA
jgi:transcriptional regulator with XRE-family HTH domain